MPVNVFRIAVYSEVIWRREVILRYRYVSVVKGIDTTYGGDVFSRHRSSYCKATKPSPSGRNAFPITAPKA
jgi:hypothetical protein